MKKIIVGLLFTLILFSACSSANTNAVPDTTDYVEQLNRISASFDEFSLSEEQDAVDAFGIIKSVFYAQYGEYPIIDAQQYTAQTLKEQGINPENLLKFVGEYATDKNLSDTFLVVQAMPDKVEVVKEELEKRLEILKENYKKHTKNPSELRIQAGQVLQNADYLALSFVGIIPKEMVSTESGYVTGTADSKA